MSFTSGYLSCRCQIALSDVWALLWNTALALQQAGPAALGLSLRGPDAVWSLTHILHGMREHPAAGSYRALPPCTRLISAPASALHAVSRGAWMPASLPEVEHGTEFASWQSLSSC